MNSDRKDTNIQVGKRLREARINMNIDKSEIADVLGISVNHYQRIETGITGLSLEKMYVLYEKYQLDPAYLITGVSSKAMDFNLDYFVANSTREQRKEFFNRVLAYMSRLLK